MVKGINFIQYKKLKDLDLQFKEGLNIISGTNGTCKTSILQIISNSYQKVTNACNWVNDKKSLSLLNNTNKVVNAKIESLTKGDKIYADPAPKIRGPLFSVIYDDDLEYKFRKHNCQKENRYSLKPIYPNGKRESLPFLPVLYLGITRLYPIGEYDEESQLKMLRSDLPDQYIAEIEGIYSKHTDIHFNNLRPQAMGNVKIRPDFNTSAEGVDSNTISAGEDNLYIILHALMSLRYYYESITSEKTIESILLIDELDATLHPSLQNALIDLFIEYGRAYKIQTIVTTHSLSAIKHGLDKKCNVVYLINMPNCVKQIDDVSFPKIEMYLKNKTKDDVFSNKKITVYMEDDEARLFFRHLMSSKPNNAYQYFHMPDCKIGAETLVNLFNDYNLSYNYSGCICILDGDKSRSISIKDCIMSLPGDSSVEKIMMDYALALGNNDDFWSIELMECGYTYELFRETIKPDIEEMKQGQKEREWRKSVFNKHLKFFEFVIEKWIHDGMNEDSPNYASIRNFYTNLENLFNKISKIKGIPMNEWSWSN